MPRIIDPVWVAPDPYKPTPVWRRVLWRLLLSVGTGLGVPRVPIRSIIVMALCAIVYVWGIPHLRLSYTFSGPREYPIYHRCDYVGVGMVRTQGPICPIVIWRQIPKEWLAAIGL